MALWLAFCERQRRSAIVRRNRYDTERMHLGYAPRDPSKIPETATLGELGVDSLMTAEIKQTLERGYDVMLGVQEIRALTFAKLRGIGSEAPTQNETAADADADGASAQAINNAVPFATFDELMPKQVLVKLPSQLPTNNGDRPVFMVHSIEGVVDPLRVVAENVRGTVYGLQCAASAPLDGMAALAHFYVKHMRTVQPQPPYTLLGYSFGAGVAFEMALQLEKEGYTIQLVLVDGSPAYITTRINRASLSGKRIRNPLHDQINGQIHLLAYLGKIFYGLDPDKVANELRPLPDWEARVDCVTELIVSSGVRVERQAVREAAQSFFGKLELGDTYKPAARLRAPVMLFTARDSSYMELGEDYGLRALSEGEVSTRQLAGTHRTILVGDAARSIADYVSDLLAKN